MNEDFERLQAIYDTVIEFAIRYGFQVIGAIIILVIGILIARLVANIVMKLCNKGDVDVTLTKFFVGVAKLLVLAFALIIAMAKFGITIAPMVAAIGAGATTASALADRCQASPRGVRILCDYLTVHGWLTKSGEDYALGEEAAARGRESASVLISGRSSSVHDRTRAMHRFAALGRPRGTCVAPVYTDPAA